MIFVQSFLYSGDANTCCREGALEGRNHFGIRPKKVKAVFKMTADLKFGITEHLHKEFYNGIFDKIIVNDTMHKMDSFNKG